MSCPAFLLCVHCDSFLSFSSLHQFKMHNSWGQFQASSMVNACAWVAVCSLLPREARAVPDLALQTDGKPSISAAPPWRGSSLRRKRRVVFLSFCCCCCCCCTTPPRPGRGGGGREPSSTHHRRYHFGKSTSSGGDGGARGCRDERTAVFFPREAIKCNRQQTGKQCRPCVFFRRAHEYHRVAFLLEAGS